MLVRKLREVMTICLSLNFIWITADNEVVNCPIHKLTLELYLSFYIDNQIHKWQNLHYLINEIYLHKFCQLFVLNSWNQQDIHSTALSRKYTHQFTKTLLIVLILEFGEDFWKDSIDWEHCTSGLLQCKCVDKEA